MTDEEAAALAAALMHVEVPAAAEAPQQPSRWKLAARRPDLEIEELRAL